MKTLIFDLKMKLAGEKLTRSLESFYRSVPSLVDVRSQTFNVAKADNADTPKSETYQTLIGSKINILVPNAPLDILVTVDANSLTFTDVNTPVILPGNITSIQFTNKDHTKSVDVFILQGSGE